MACKFCGWTEPIFARELGNGTPQPKLCCHRVATTLLSGTTIAFSRPVWEDLRTGFFGGGGSLCLALGSKILLELATRVLLQGKTESL